MVKKATLTIPKGYMEVLDLYFSKCILKNAELKWFRTRHHTCPSWQNTFFISKYAKIRTFPKYKERHSSGILLFQASACWSGSPLIDHCYFFILLKLFKWTMVGCTFCRGNVCALVKSGRRWPSENEDWWFKASSGGFLIFSGDGASQSGSSPVHHIYLLLILWYFRTCRQSNILAY